MDAKRKVWGFWFKRTIFATSFVAVLMVSLLWVRSDFFVDQLLYGDVIVYSANGTIIMEQVFYPDQNPPFTWTTYSPKQFLSKNDGIDLTQYYFNDSLIWDVVHSEGAMGLYYFWILYLVGLPLEIPILEWVWLSVKKRCFAISLPNNSK